MSWSNHLYRSARLTIVAESNGSSPCKTLSLTLVSFPTVNPGSYSVVPNRKKGNDAGIQ